MKWTCISLVLLCTFSLFISYSQKGDEKGALTNQRAKILKDLEESKRILRNVKKDKTSSLLVLNAIQNKLDARKALIKNYQNSVVELDESLRHTESEINELEKDLVSLKKNYAKMIKYAYLHRTSLNIISFIFSAENYSQAFKRLGYLRKYRQVRDKQVDAIVHSQKQLELKAKQVDQQMASKTTLLNAQISQKNTLEKERHEKVQAYENFKGQEKEIQAKIAKQQADARKLQGQIQYLIKKEMEANAARIAREKARQERIVKAKEADRKRKLEEARIAREKAEEEKRRIEQERIEQERLAMKEREEEAARVRAEYARLQKIKDDERAKKKQEEMMARAKKAAEEAYRKRQEELAEIRKNEKAAEAKLAKAKAEENKNTEAIIPTSTGMTGFGTNGLSRPVSGRVVGHFGTQSHPVFPNIKIENNGMDIYSSSGSPVHAVYQGTVSSILPTPGGNGSTILINHGEYFTVYTNLASIKVGTGSTVNKGQIIGTVGSNSEGEPIINFQVWKSTGGTSYKMNPENWVRY